MKNKKLEKAVILGLLLCCFNRYGCTETITGSASYSGDTVIDGGDIPAMELIGRNRNDEFNINIDKGTLTLQNNDIYSSQVKLGPATVNFTGQNILVKCLHTNALNCGIDIGISDTYFKNEKTEITGNIAIGILTRYSKSIFDKKLEINLDRSHTDEDLNHCHGLYITEDSQITTNDTDINMKCNKTNFKDIYDENKVHAAGTYNSGVWVGDNCKFTANGTTNISVEGGLRSAGFSAYGGTVNINNDLNIDVKNAVRSRGIELSKTVGSKSTDFKCDGNVNIKVDGVHGGGIYVWAGSKAEVNGHLKIDAKTTGTSWYAGIHSCYDSTFRGKSADISVTGNDMATGIITYGDASQPSSVYFSDTVKINAKYALYATDKGTIELAKDFISTHDDSLIETKKGAQININTSGLGTVNFTGRTSRSIISHNNINMWLNNKDSYWKMTGDSSLTKLNLSEALLDMTADKNKFNMLILNELSGNNGLINMDIDLSKNTNNSDRIYIGVKHSGTHYISLNNVSDNNSDAVGTVLVSVRKENGEFKAKDSESKLYWTEYELGRMDAGKGDTVTSGYDTDWYLKKADKVDPGTKPSTSVGAVVSANSLNYYTWRTENDKLMQRMGELRHNGDAEKGAWFRVKGSKIGRDGSFNFANKYTTYELGFDEKVNQTDDMVRYQGAALSYTKGNSKYSRGSGDNSGKSISFYNTEQYAKGYYLDVVFKVNRLSNNFKVFNTKNQKITGEQDNTGVSISAEYGRKNDLKHGWYIEPQAQLTLGYMGGANYETSNGISVEQSGTTSAVGRVGFNVGKQIGKCGIIYAKANLLHEFGGGSDIVMKDSKDRIIYKDTFNDTWLEYGVGAAFTTSKNSHLYFDVERSTGGDFYKDWQWNAGVRWTF